MSGDDYIYASACQRQSVDIIFFFASVPSSYKVPTHSITCETYSVLNIMEYMLGSV